MKSRRIRVIDRAGTVTSALRAIDLIPMGGPTQREITQEGLVAPANISKVGLQGYRAGELGIPGMDANRMLIAYRPDSEVFDPAAVKSFELNPLANDHTPEDVSPDNWRKYASEGRIAGDIREVGRAADQKHLGAKLIVRDKKAIEDIVGGKSQLSCGYTFDADWTPGEYEGQKYDFVQRRIRGNHVAIVDLARGGYGCRIADRQPSAQRRTSMETDIVTVPITINGITFRVVADDSANAIATRDAYDKMSALHKSACDALTEAKGHMDAMKAQHKAVVGRLAPKDEDEEEMVDSKKGKDGVTLVELIDEKVAGVRRGLKKASDAAIATVTTRATDAEKKVLTEAQIDALVATKETVKAGAKKLIGDGFKADGKTIGAIRIEALRHIVANDAALKPVAVAVLGATDLGAADAAVSPLVSAAFDAVVAAKPAQATVANDSGSPLIRSILAHDGGTAPAATGTQPGRTAVIDMSDPQGTMRMREQNGGLIPGQAAGI